MSPKYNYINIIFIIVLICENFMKKVKAMIITEFYRQKLAQLERYIENAELERDFKKAAKLQAKKSDIEKRIKEI